MNKLIENRKEKARSDMSMENKKKLSDKVCRLIRISCYQKNSIVLSYLDNFSLNTIKELINNSFPIHQN
jgi:hypothetical protein